MAQQKSIKMLAITDHDNADAYTHINSDDFKDLQLISGIEFSTSWNKVGIHIVGLNFDLNSTPINEAINTHKLLRLERAKIISKRLTKIGLINGFEKLAKNEINQIGRPNFANLLVDEGICTDNKQAFKKYLGAGKIGDVKNRWLSFNQIIQTILKSGGIPVLAHPLVYKLTNSKLKRLICDFKQSGGQALEVINGYQNSDKTIYLQNLCKQYDLLSSIGSDFHRKNNWTQLGCNTLMVSENHNVWNNILRKCRISM